MLRASLVGTLMLAGTCAIAQSLPADKGGGEDEDESRPAAGALQPVTVTATRIEQSGFELPAPVSVVEAGGLRGLRAGGALDQAVAAVPGLLVRDRQNLAQDLQVSSRGFGARAAFGVRGVRLIQDGVPLTMPDGQGQTGLLDLDSAARIEVLRGPFATLYGNSAGGVLTVRSEEPPTTPTLSTDFGAGSFGVRRYGLSHGQSLASGLAARLRFSRLDTDGLRAHSSARRDLFGAQFVFGQTPDARLSLSVSVLDQPDTLDPLGLTAEQMHADRRQAGNGALEFNTRKSVEHRQAGVQWERRFGAQSLTVRSYAGERRVVQSLAFSGSAATSSGGIVDLDRGFGGLGLQWARRFDLTWGPANLSIGLDYDRMSERRRGFVNLAGVAGDLRRNERNTVWNLDQYLIGDWWFAERWRVAGGVRRSQVRFDIDDDFVQPGNADDSGALRYGATRPVIGVLYQANERLNVYASAGRGFETPTFAELAYRPDGAPGPNLSLRSSTSESFELGLKARIGADTQLEFLVFRTDTRDDIVPDENVGGRSTYRNAARTARRGLELALVSELGAGFSGQLALTALDAEFRDYRSVAGQELSGKTLPGVPARSLFGELAWRHPGSGFGASAEILWNDAVYADDLNTAKASGSTRINLRLGYDWQSAGWSLRPYLHLLNLTDRQHVGSVIVNAAGGRFYEPAPGRNWAAGLQLRAQF